MLSRRRVDFPRLHRALLARDVAVEVVGLGGLIEMPEVADVVAMLSLLVDPTANAAAVRVLTGPRWRLGVRDLAALGRRAGQLATWSPPGSDSDDEPAAGEDLERALQAATDSVDPAELASLLDAIESPGRPAEYSAEAVQRINAFGAEVRRLRELVGAPLVDLVSEVVSTIGLAVEIEADEQRVAVARIANLHAFIDHAAHFVGLEGESDLSSFLAYLRSANDNEDGLDVGAVSDADTVKLMTVHKAKGLEWDVVAVPGLVDKTFPSGRGRSSWLTGSQVLPFGCRGDAADLPVLRGYTAKDVEAFKADCKADEADEERRLAYVALTRARRRAAALGVLLEPDPQGPGRALALPRGDPGARRADGDRRLLVRASPRMTSQPAAGRRRRGRAVAVGPRPATDAGPAGRCGAGAAAAGRPAPARPPGSATIPRRGSGRRRCCWTSCDGDA